MVKFMPICLFVCSPEPLEAGYPTQSVKISALDHNFLIDYGRDFSLILHICTRPQIDSFV